MSEIDHFVTRLEPEFRAPCPHRTKLTFAAPAPLAHLEFRNYYAATVAVEAQLHGARSRDAEGEPAWQPLVPPVALMADPHCEADAQRWRRLCLTPDGAPTEPCVALRITLTQPSPCWRTVRLDELKCYGPAAATTPRQPAAPPSPARALKADIARALHRHTDAQAVIGLLESAAQLRETLRSAAAPRRQPSMFTLSYDEVVIGDTAEKHPSPLVEDYLRPGLRVRGATSAKGDSGGESAGGSQASSSGEPDATAEDLIPP